MWRNGALRSLDLTFPAWEFRGDMRVDMWKSILDSTASLYFLYPVYEFVMSSTGYLPAVQTLPAVGVAEVHVLVHGDLREILASRNLNSARALAAWPHHTARFRLGVSRRRLEMVTEPTASLCGESVEVWLVTPAVPLEGWTARVCWCASTANAP